MKTKHNCIKADALKLFTIVYNEVKDIEDFNQRIKYTKRITIKAILNTCDCYQCQDACYLIETLNFYNK